MKIYSCAYPIYYTIPVDNLDRIEYEIKNRGKIIYKGILYPKEAKPLKIDLSNIFREYLNTSYEDYISDSTKVYESVDKFELFEVSNSNDDDAVGEYLVKYDYNLDYQSLLNTTDSLNEPIVTDLDINQHLFLGSYSIDGKHSISYSVNGTNTVRKDFNPGNRTSMINLNLRDVNIKAGDIFNVKYYLNNKPYNEINFRVINPCNNRYVIHYVNNKGGLDSMLCSGKAELKYSSKSTKVAINDSYSDRNQFSHLPITTDITKSYTLNTGILSDERAALIYNVIDSPKVWIEDMNEGTITACIITENSKTVKNYRNDKVVSYSISLEESQKYIRK